MPVDKRVTLLYPLGSDRRVRVPLLRWKTQRGLVVRRFLLRHLVLDEDCRGGYYPPWCDICSLIKVGLKRSKVKVICSLNRFLRVQVIDVILRQKAHHHGVRHSLLSLLLQVVEFTWLSRRLVGHQLTLNFSPLVKRHVDSEVCGLRLRVVVVLALRVVLYSYLHDADLINARARLLLEGAGVLKRGLSLPTSLSLTAEIQILVC